MPDLFITDRVTDAPKKGVTREWERDRRQDDSKPGPAVPDVHQHLFQFPELPETCHRYGDVSVSQSGPPGRRVDICCLWGPVMWNYRLNQVLPISFTSLLPPPSLCEVTSIHLSDTSHNLPLSPWHSFMKFLIHTTPFCSAPPLPAAWVLRSKIVLFCFGIGFYIRMEQSLGHEVTSEGSPGPIEGSDQCKAEYEPNISHNILQRWTNSGPGATFGSINYLVRPPEHSQ